MLATKKLAFQDGKDGKEIKRPDVIKKLEFSALNQKPVQQRS